MASSNGKTAPSAPKKTITRMTPSERKTLGARVVKLRAAGASWAEIKEKTGVPGGITGRKLIRLAGAKGLIAESYDREAAKVARAKAAKAARPKAARPKAAPKKA